MFRNGPNRYRTEKFKDSGKLQNSAKNSVFVLERKDPGFREISRRSSREKYLKNSEDFRNIVLPFFVFFRNFKLIIFGELRTILKNPLTGPF